MEERKHFILKPPPPPLVSLIMEVIFWERKPGDSLRKTWKIMQGQRNTLEWLKSEHLCLESKFLSYTRKKEAALVLPLRCYLPESETISLKPKKPRSIA